MIRSRCRRTLIPDRNRFSEADLLALHFEDDTITIRTGGIRQDDPRVDHCGIFRFRGISNFQTDDPRLRPPWHWRESDTSTATIFNLDVDRASGRAALVVQWETYQPSVDTTYGYGFTFVAVEWIPHPYPARPLT